jgi:2Fe-2S ferredoxin
LGANSIVDNRVLLFAFSGSLRFYFHRINTVTEGFQKMLDLKGRFKQKTVEGEVGFSLLDIALKHDIDWGFSCTRGTCARCRCFVESGSEFLSDPNDAELDRLEPEEIEEGYRLGCQAEITADGDIKAVNKPYF